MNLEKDLYQIQTSAEDMAEETKEAQNVNQIVATFFDKEKGVQPEEIAKILKSYESNKGLKDEQVDLIATMKYATLPAYVEKLKEYLKSGPSYKKAKNTAKKLLKTVNYMNKSIHKIMKYIKKHDKNQISSILHAYDNRAKEAQEVKKLKYAAMSPYM